MLRPAAWMIRVLASIGDVFYASAAARGTPGSRAVIRCCGYGYRMSWAVVRCPVATS
jgi:hypothetical protein